MREAPGNHFEFRSHARFWLRLIGFHQPLLALAADVVPPHRERRAFRAECDV